MKQFAAIERFLKFHGHESLFSYLNLDRNASPQAIQTTLQQRRIWAQSQQHNPRHQEEARWLIRNMGHVFDALTTHRTSYIRSQKRARLLQRASHVAHFIVVMGVSDETTPLIRSYGRRSGLSEHHITALLKHHETRYSSVA